jgi:sulfhydrogenase subunit gamma (sulfur reductase)
MINPYETKTAKIVKISDQTPGIKLFEFGFDKMHFQLRFDEDAKIQPGQFVILSLPGFGEAPFAPCNRAGKNLELCIRTTGKLTNRMHTLKVGDKIGIRGPFGSGWPIKNGKKNVLIVVGGLGLIPLRTLILSKNDFLEKGAKVQIFYGAKHPSEMLFHNEFDSWQKNGINLQLSIDKTCEGWQGCVGVVTKLFDVAQLVPDAKVFVCGPPIMYKFVLEKLKKHGFGDEDIYLSLERRMHCGVGVCQHCGVGSYYTCKHGPVFRYDQIKNIQGAI